jgi:hypothetical protein
MRFLTLFVALCFGMRPDSRGTGTIEEATASLLQIDNNTYIDANNIKMLVTNHGSWAFDRTHMAPGMWYPNGSESTMIYASGIWVGAEIAEEKHVTPGTFCQEYTPGPILAGCTWPDSSAPEHRVYKIVRGDTLSDDYVNWPAEYGAPVDNSGRPLLKGDQTLWCVYSDADPAVHDCDEGSAMHDPMGIEVQQTAFAFDEPGALGNVIFMEFRIINKCDYLLENTYFSIWCDPDIGGASDDYVGCCPLLSLVYAYNADNDDDMYGTSPPCLGYDLLKGTVADNGWRQYMTAFSVFWSGMDPRALEESYNSMMGLDIFGNPVIDPTTGQVTKFTYAGDPVSGTGWLDEAPDDKRFLMTSGPFTMEPEDTQDIALAIVVGHGEDRLESVRIMKQYDAVAQVQYKFNFGTPVFPSFEVTAGENETHLTWVCPDRSDLTAILIRYSLEAYPEHPTAGLPVPNGAAGTFPASAGAAGSFTHTGLAAGMTYHYRAFARDGDGTCSAFMQAEASPTGSSAGVVIPGSEERLLLAASPNPSRGAVAIRYAAPVGESTRLGVYDTSGRFIRSLRPDVPGGGTSTTAWDGRNDAGEQVPSGIYFIQLESGGRFRVTKAILIR